MLPIILVVHEAVASRPLACLHNFGWYKPLPLTYNGGGRKLKHTTTLSERVPHAPFSSFFVHHTACRPADHFYTYAPSRSVPFRPMAHGKSETDIDEAVEILFSRTRNSYDKPPSFLQNTNTNQIPKPNNTTPHSEAAFKNTQNSILKNQQPQEPS